MGKRSIIFSDFINRFNDISKGEYEYIDGYSKMTSKINIRHICGKEFSPIASAFINAGTRCPKCNHKSVIYKKTTKEYEEEIFEITNGEYQIISDYIDHETDVTYKHLTCGKIYKTKPRNFTRGHRCIYCNNRSYPYSIEELQKLCSKDFNVIKYISTKRQIIIKCKRCNTEKIISIYIFMKGIIFNNECCNIIETEKNKLINKFKKTLKKQIIIKNKNKKKEEKINKYKSDVKSIHGDNISIIECTEKNEELLIAKCNSCKELFFSKFKYLRRSQGCPYCNISKGEKKIKIFLERNNVKFIQEYSFSNPEIRSLRFDFAIFINNTLKLIEYDGKQHFNKESQFGTKDKNVKFEKIVINDNKKNNFCNSNNIELLRISYLDYDIIDSILNKYIKNEVSL